MLFLACLLSFVITSIILVIYFLIIRRNNIILNLLIALANINMFILMLIYSLVIDFSVVWIIFCSVSILVYFFMFIYEIFSFIKTKIKE